MASRVQRTDFAYDPLSLPVKTQQGTMVVEGYFTSSGVFSYPQEDGTILREWRPPSEVEDATSLDSLRMVPVTIGHPEEPVTLENFKTLAVGTLGDSIRTDSEWGVGPRGEGRKVKVRGKAVLHDAAAIAVVEAKEMPEVSCGYQCDLELVAGVTPEGEVYDAIQRRIIYNHLAIGVIGRQGPGVALRVDSSKPPAASRPTTKDSTMKIRIDGVDFDGSEQLAQAVEKMGERHTTALAAEKARADSLAVDKAAVEKKLGEAEARADAAAAAVKEAEKKAAELNAKIKEGVKARKNLEKMAEKVMGAEAFKAAGIEDIDDENEIKAAVVKAADPNRDLTEKVTLAKQGDVAASAYISAAFDILSTAAAPAGEGSQSQATGDSVSGSGTLRARTTAADSVNADAARDAAIKARNEAWRPKKA